MAHIKPRFSPGKLDREELATFCRQRGLNSQRRVPCSSPSLISYSGLSSVAKLRSRGRPIFSRIGPESARPTREVVGGSSGPRAEMETIGAKRST
ncbi:hypothetical protein NL676_027338 [Syzygium grande]|nr:hypothetical protein NL676_027338 [Syzygium grande]